MKVLSLESDLALGSGFVVGPMFSYAFPKELENTPASVGLWTLGLRGNYFFSGKAFVDSWYISGYYNYMKLFANASLPDTTAELSAGQSGSALGALIGYHWFWKSGFNLSTGLGIARYSGGTSSAEITVRDSSGNRATTSVESSVPAGDKSMVLPSIELTMGWAF